MDDTALAPAKWQRSDNTGPLLWEGEGACPFSRRLAALGMACWRDVTDMRTGAWLTWAQAQRKYGASGASDKAAYGALRAQLARDPRADEWLASAHARSALSRTWGVDEWILSIWWVLMGLAAHGGTVWHAQTGG